MWRLPVPAEKTIIAQRIDGTVCFGDVKLLPAETTEVPTKATDAT